MCADLCLEQFWNSWKEMRRLAFTQTPSVGYCMVATKQELAAEETTAQEVQPQPQPALKMIWVVESKYS